MSKQSTANVNVPVEVLPDPLAANKTELLAARAQAASMQTAAQQKASIAQITDWVAYARELGLALYERQPEESDKEWYIWTTYRSYYPGRMPSWSELAKQVGSTPATVVKTANKWKFRLRIVEWSRYTDADVAAKRIAAIKEMNVAQLEQARTLRQKVTEALDYLDPAALRPNELATLMRLANEQERQIVEQVPEKVEGQILSGADAVSAAKQTDVAAIGDILNIMMATGALGNKLVGIEKKTVTTERVVVGGTEEQVDE